jgi:VWFA-related protein
MLAGFAIGQTSDSAKELPSAPSATAQEQAPPKQAPPTNDSKPPAQPPRQKPDQELKLGEHIVKAPPPAADTAEPKTDPPAQSTDPAVPPATSPTQPAPAPGVPHLEDVPQGPEDSPAATFIRFANEVRVIFTVTDKRGRYIKDLKREDFKVLDDRKPAVRINSFDAQTNLPLQVALLIDASNSIRDRFKFEQEAAIEFLNSIIRPRFDQAMTVGFDSTPDVTQDFTDNTELLSKGVRALKAGGGTAMYDALYATCRDHLLKQQQTGPVRRAIILLSDGDDNSSHVTREEAIEMAQRSEVIVYTISTNITGSKSKSDKVLERIAEATGGRAFFPFQIRDVSDAFASIQDELRSQYAMSYRPADLVADGHFRTIEILAQQKAFHVRTRKGYYAPKR